jgi:hypothetical protein
MKYIVNFLKAYSCVLLVTAFFEKIIHYDNYPLIQGYFAGSLGALTGVAIGTTALGALCGLALDLVINRGKFQGTTFTVTCLLLTFAPWGFDFFSSHQ